MNSKIRPFLFWLLVAGLTGACDVLNEETPQEYDVQVLTDKVFASELQSSSIINLNTLIRAKVPVKFSIAESTHNGKLDVSNIHDGIIKYSSAYGVIQPDNFKFTISSSTNEMLKQQDVNVVLADEQNELPCNTVLPFNDHFINLGAPGTVVVLDVLKNDWMCDEMRTKVQVVVYDDNATVTADNKIRYTVRDWNPDWGNTNEHGWYSVAMKSNPSIRWYGQYVLTFDNTCDLSPGFMDDNDPYDGIWGYSIPIASASTIKFNPLTNASLCGYSLSEVDVTIVHQPKFGTARLHPSKSFSYTPFDTGTATYTDLIIYKVSLPNGKWKTQVMKLRLASDKPCTQGAVDDVLGVATTYTNGQLLPVINNDCNRPAITSITMVTPPVNGTATVGTWLSTWSILYKPNPNKNPDVIEYEATYQDGSSSRAKVYVTPYDPSN